MKLVPLTQGQFALVDDADFEAVNAHKWYAHKPRHCFYAVRTIQNPDGKWAGGGRQYMHRFLMPGVGEVHHIDGNGLNNQRCNLLLATTQHNARGFRRKSSGKTSRFRGVCWDARRGKWKAELDLGAGKRKFLGYYILEIDAARARDTATLKYYGPDAQLNFPILQ